MSWSVVGAAAEDGSLLVVLLETHSNLWAQLPADAKGHKQLSVSSFLEQVSDRVN